MSRISKNIKKFRTVNNMTQEDLALKIHVTRQTVSSWETGRTQPDLQILQSLAEAFGIETEELIYGKRKNNADEKEKALFSNTLVTVLSVLGCLLIGVGVVMIFIKYWQDFPDILKLLTCFIPALLGQGVGIYTYIKKKESLPWCEGACVLWMLGTCVTTWVVTSQVGYPFVNDALVYLFLAAGAFVLMTVFKTLSPLAVAHVFSLMWFVTALDDRAYYYMDLEDGANKITAFLLFVSVQAVFTGLTVFVSTKLHKKENNVIRHAFSEWINFAAIVAAVCFSVERTEIGESFIALIALATIICLVIGERHENFASPYKLLGTVGSAAVLCFFSIISAVDLYTEKWVNAVILIICLVPLPLFLIRKTRPRNACLRAYGILLTSSLFIFNFICFLVGFGRDEVSEKTFNMIEFSKEALFNLNFVVSLAGLIMLVIYGAKVRKLLYLNLGFVLSCVSVIAKLYLLDLGLIVTGLMLIACGVGLLFVNLKISRLSEKEKVVSLEEGEEEEQ